MPHKLMPQEPTREMEMMLKRLTYDLFVDWQEGEEQLRSVYPKIYKAIWEQLEWRK